MCIYAAHMHVRTVKESSMHLFPMFRFHLCVIHLSKSDRAYICKTTRIPHHSHLAHLLRRRTILALPHHTRLYLGEHAAIVSSSTKCCSESKIKYRSSNLAHSHLFSLWCHHGKLMCSTISGCTIQAQ